MTTCGHNYCQQCLAGIGRNRSDSSWICPECRTEQQKRPERLPRNFFLEKSVQNFIETRNSKEHSRHERNAMQEQLDELQQQLAHQKKIAADAEEMSKHLVDPNLFEDVCVEFQQLLNEEKDKNQTVSEANKNLQTRQENLEGQLQFYVLQLYVLFVKLNQLEKDQIKTNDELAKTKKGFILDDNR